MRLAYHVFGPADGRPLLCVHGFLDHGQSFRFLAEQLPSFRVVAPDVRGHGASDWVGPGGYYHFYDYYDDARALVDALGWSQFALLGHSMGGSIATGLAALEADRVEALIVLEGMGPSFADLSKSVDRLRGWSFVMRKAPHAEGPEGRRAARRVMADVDAAARRLRAVNPRLAADRARGLAETFTEPVEGRRRMALRPATPDAVGQAVRPGRGRSDVAGHPGAGVVDPGRREPLAT